MPRRNRRISRRRRGNRLRGERIPTSMARFVDQPAIHTLSVLVNATDTSPGLVHWDQLDGFLQLADFYQYFVPQGYKIDIYGTTTTNTFSVGTVPINYIVDLPFTASPTASSVSELRGHVTYQAGSNNRGPWAVWPRHIQQLSTNPAAPEIAAVVLVGSPVTQTVTVQIFITICFYRKNLNTTTGLTHTIQRNGIILSSSPDVINSSFNDSRSVESLQSNIYVRSGKRNTDT